MSNEIITFQFGNYSNYIGAHYWNIQKNQLLEGNESNESKNYDLNTQVLFRDSLNIQNKETFTPRVILFESKDNVNNQVQRDVRHHSYHSRSKPEKPMENIDLNWKGEVEVYAKEQKEIEEYTVHEIEQGVHKKHMKSSVQQEGYWTDYMKFEYNEHSYSYVDSQLEPFDLFNYGLNALEGANFSDDFENKIRYFAEECGQIQGIQMFADSFDGFGGLTSKSVSYLSEEFSKRPIMTYLPFPYFDEQAIELNTFKLINTALTLKNIFEDNQHTLITPLSMFDSFYLSKDLKPVELDSVQYLPNSSYQTSGILASLIDCSTTPYIQKNKFTLMSDIIDLFDVYNYKLAAMQAVFPIKIEKDKYLYNYLHDTDLVSSSKWFTPFCSTSSFNSSEKTSQVTGVFEVCCKGVIDERVKNPRDLFVFSSVVPANVVLDRYFCDMYPKSKSACFSSKVPLNTESPYPNIFQSDELFNTEGSSGENKIPLMTILQTNKSILNWIKFIDSHIQDTSFVKYPRYFENGMEQEDFTELINFFRDLSDNFSI